MNNHRKCTAESNLTVINATLPSGNPLRFRCNLPEELEKTNHDIG